MKIEIRRAVYSDAINIISAHRRSIRELCSKDYSPAQITAWSGRDFQEEHWRRTMDKDLVWVIADQANNIYGFGHLKFREDSQAEIAGLYFVPEVTGKGLGKSLVQIMFDECWNKGTPTVVLTATKTAKTFYQRMDLEQTGLPISIKIGDQQVECINMKTTLIK